MTARPYTPYRETKKRTGDMVYDSVQRKFVRFVAPKERRRKVVSNG